MFDRFLGTPMYTVLKVSVFGVFLVLFFPALGLDTGKCGVLLRIQPGCAGERSRKGSTAGIFHALVVSYSFSQFLEINTFLSIFVQTLL